MKIHEGDLYLDAVKDLIIEYTKMLNRDLEFQDFNDELNHLEKKYTMPNGRIFVAIENDCVVGCVAYYRHNEIRCEMKRLYVKPEYRHMKIGQKLIETLIDYATRDGYQEIVLDTIQPLQSAIALYKKNGFLEIDAYYHNPMDDVIYMKLKL